MVAEILKIASPVSAIITSHNRRKQLTAAIESVLNQTRPPHELIIIDDASTDGTAAYLADLQIHAQETFLKIHLASENAGVSTCRNLGAKLATMPWLAFLDSDDTWHPTKLAEQMKMADSNPNLRIFYCDEKWVRNGTNVNRQKQHHKLGGSIFAECVDMCLIGASSILIAKALFDQHGGFDESFTVCEDYDLWLRISAKEDIGYSELKMVTKHAGHADQLSIRYLAMDQWRLKSILNLFFHGGLSQNQFDILRKAIISKSKILASSFLKHQRYEQSETFVHLERSFKDGTENPKLADFEILQLVR